MQHATNGLLTTVIRYRKATVAIALFILVVALWSLTVIGTEFMPRLDEGSILVETRKLPGISLTDSVEISKRIEQKLRAFPEIADVVIKIGRPDFATEAMGINEGDTYLLLKPMDQWHRFHSKEELIEGIDKELVKIPGLSYNFTQPMAMRIDETVSGVKADLAIKVFGDDFDTLDSLGATGSPRRCRRTWSCGRTDSTYFRRARSHDPHRPRCFGALWSKRFRRGRGGGSRRLRRLSSRR